VIVAIRVVAALVASEIGKSFVATGTRQVVTTNSLVSSFIKWDAGWYVRIAQHGYPTLKSHAFYPAYPLLIRVFSPLVGFSGGALAVAWIAAVFAVWGVIDVARRFASLEAALLVGALFAWNPASIFLVAGYPEGLLVAAMIWSLRFALEKKWLRAALLAGAASCILPQGTVSALVVVLAVIVSEPRRRGLIHAIFYGAVGELGLIGLLVYGWVSTGNAFVNERAEKYGWHNDFTYPFHVVLRELSMIANSPANGQVRSVYVLNATAGILGGVLAAAGLYLCWRDRKLLLPVTLLALGVFVSVVTIDLGADSTARFILFLAPLYVLGAVLIDRVPARARLPLMLNVLLCSSMLAVLYGAMFNFGWWLT
jgi:hypothetical protein